VRCTTYMKVHLSGNVKRYVFDILQSDEQNLATYKVTQQFVKCGPWLKASLQWSSWITWYEEDDDGWSVGILWVCDTGRALRLPQVRPASVATQWMPGGGKRKRGRPSKTWRQTFQKDLQEIRVSWSGVHRAAAVIRTFVVSSPK